MQAKRDSKYDIIIVGGGMVGMTLACALAKTSSLSIAILEARESDYAFDGNTNYHRVSAVALSSKRIFQGIDVWQTMQAARVSPFNAMHVWDNANQAEISFHAKEIAEPVLGYIVENAVMLHALRQRLRDFSQVHFISSVTLSDYQPLANGVRLVAEDGRKFQAQLAVAADGANSWLREKSGITVNQHQYEQYGLVATVTTEKAHQLCARQVFLKTGPLAFLPLKDEKMCSIVWSLPVAEANRLCEVDEAIFRCELENAFNFELGEVVATGQRFAFPLRRQQASDYVRDRAVMVGDAAHVMHPLAGQGVNVGLLDAASLAEVIVAACDKEQDFASVKVLRQYERWRRAENVALLTGVDLIKHLFASEKPAVKMARGMGLNLTNKISMLKNLFARYATGGRDGLPALAKPILM